MPLAGSLINITVILLWLASAGTFYGRWYYQKRGWNKDLSILFLFIGCYFLTVNLPLFISNTQVNWIGWAHIAGFGFLALAMIQSLRLPMFKNIKVIKNNFEIIIWSLGFLGLVIMAILSYEVQPPVTSGWLTLWSPHPVAGWLAGLLVLSYGTAWIWLFSNACLKIRKKEARIKMQALGLAGFSLGLAGWFHFTAINFWLSGISFALSALSGLLVAYFILLPKWLKILKK
ncbi:MAG: hypothetical protein ACOCU8_00305 [Patescibacteria group bacterium]